MTTTRIESRLDKIEQNQETLRAEISEFRQIFKEVQDGIRGLAGMVSASSQRKENSDQSTCPERTTLAPVTREDDKRIEMANFSGDDPYGWIAKAEQYFTLQVTPELWKIDIAFLSMKGDALVWFQWLRKQNPNLTWVQLKTQLIKKFGEDHSTSATCPSKQSASLGDKGKPPNSSLRGFQESSGLRWLGSSMSLADLEVIKVIGKGSIANVKLVKHKPTQQFFALKVIQLNTEESTCRAISQELRINLSSQCPYIVSCYQSFYHNGLVSIILEFMDGGSLADLLNKVQRIPENILAAICKRVLRGLCYIHHERRIIHRDLKPSSLLINHRGEVKITDFVVSKILSSTSSVANSFVGTYNYMSPERISGSLYGTKSDIWSLGLVLLECATGRFPYTPPEQGTEWSSLYELLDAIVENPPPSAPSHMFSPEFCSFISQCIQRDPIDRKSAKELLEHKFVNMFEDLDADLSSYFTNAGTLIPPLTS